MQLINLIKKCLKKCNRWFLIFCTLLIISALLTNTSNGSVETYVAYIRSLVIVSSKSLMLPIRLNGAMINQTFRQRQHVPFISNQNLATQVHCIGPARNRSCLYKNLYYSDRTFWILTVKGTNLPALEVRIGAFAPYEFVPERRTFFSPSGLDAFVKFRANPIVIPDLTIFFEQPWLQNIGHALFDGLYPVYVALIRFSAKHLQPFRLLYDGPITGCQDCMSEDVYSRFADLGAMRYVDLENRSVHQWFVFDEILVGTGKFCQRCLQSTLQLPGGVELNASRLFRNRMYQKHGLRGPSPREYSLSTGWQSSSPRLRAVVIANKRFDNQDMNEIHAAMYEINDHTNQMIQQRISYEKNATRPLILMNLLNFRTLTQARNTSFANTPPQDSLFTEHLKVMQTIDIHLAGPGTGQMYQTFLPDGAVHINLGGTLVARRNNASVNYTSFLEQPVTAGTPYVKALYYPINARPSGIKKEEIIRLVLEAAQIVLKGFQIPVNPQDNLAPDGLLFREMCRVDEKFCAAVTERPITLGDSCADTWPEEIVHEVQQWSSDYPGTRHDITPCHLNRTLLHELRIKFGIQHTL